MYFSMFYTGRQDVTFCETVGRAHDFASTRRDAVATLEEEPRVERCKALLHELKVMLLVLNASCQRRRQPLPEQF